MAVLARSVCVEAAKNHAQVSPAASFSFSVYNYLHLIPTACRKRSAKRHLPWHNPSCELLYLNFLFIMKLIGGDSLEQGKTYADAKGDVLRGHQVVETACG